MCILKNDTKRSSQISLFNLVYINIIITDLSVLNIIETIDQVCDRCLSRSRRTDKSKFLSRLRVQSQIMKHHVVFRISERHIIKSHVAFQLRICHCAVCLMRMFPCPQACSFFTLRKISLCILLCVYKSNISFVYFRLFIHQRKDAFRTGQRHDDGVELLGNLHKRLSKALRKLKIRRHHAKRNVSDAEYRKRAAQYSSQNEL